MKSCRTCKEEKPDTEEFWYRTKTLGNFLSGVCKVCEDNKPTNTKKWPGRKTWDRMMRRCYSPKDPSWNTYGAIGVEVCKDFKSFENFSKWYQLSYIDGWEIDKDILGNGMLYSEDTCCYVPAYINSFFCFKKKKLEPKPYGRKFKLDMQIGTKKTVSLVYETPEECMEVYYMKKDERMKELFEKMVTEHNELNKTANPINAKLIALLANFSTRAWTENYWRSADE